MNQELWQKIHEFDLDKPHGEYGFSTRLAMENFWTQEFTRQAILEYKKFMFLAAISDFMVSPSKIIDVVWHQHLVFTQSYQEFCNLLGKQVQHLPSTRNREEFEKFRQAKERTAKSYEMNFGKQPKILWAHHDMFESLNLEKAKYKLRSIIIFGILALICMSIPAYFLLQPLFIHIDNPDFISGFFMITVFAIAALEFYNRGELENIVDDFDKNSFIHNLQPMELVYLKSQKISEVINGTVNQLVVNGAIKINSDHSIEVDKTKPVACITQKQTVFTLVELGTTFYPNLLRELAAKPIFSMIPNCMDAFVKYFNKSRKFQSIFLVNFITLGLFILLAFTRIVTGTLRDKPVSEITLITCALVAFTLFFLHRLTRMIATTTIPNLYRKEILPARKIENDWQWSYFLLGGCGGD